LQKICEERRNAGGSAPDENSSTFRILDDSNSEEFGMRELLCAIAAAYDKINVVHGKFEQPLALCLMSPLALFSSTHVSLCHAYVGNS
jgi:hypothetical protein